MSTPEITFQALLTGWDRLPGRVGDDWEEILPDIQRLIDAIAASDDEDERALLTDELLNLLRPYERAWRHLSSGMREVEQRRKAVYRGSSDTRTMPQAPDLLTLATELRTRMPFEVYAMDAGIAFSLDPEPDVLAVTRYTDITCPRRVWLETPRFPVIVRLTVEMPELSAAVLDLQVHADEEAPVLVQCSAPGFDLLSSPLQSTPVLPDADSPPLVFDLKPTQVGGSTISFDFFQYGEPLGTVSVPIETTPYEVVEGAEPRRTQPLAGPGDAPPPDIVLHIAYEPNPPALRFTLLRDGGASWQTFPPKALNGDPAAHAAEFYRRITALARKDDPTAELANRTFGAVNGGDSRGRLQSGDIDRRLRQLGQNLWRDLIPKDLQDIYGGEQEQWKDRTLLVLSDEPHIPWELLWPYGKGWSDKGPWCETLCLTRWLRSDDQGNGNAKPPVHLQLSPVALIAPTDSGLPAAQAESAMLAALFAKRELADVSPPEPTWSQVMDMLEDGKYQWVHVAAHGSFYPEAPEADSALWLQGQTALNPDAIVGPEIETHLAEQRPVFIFNCCEVGRQGWSLTQIGGWANRLIGAGAGLYIGPHWVVSDGPAKNFALSLYENLLAGDPVGEAVRKARRVARQQGDPTWLAYSVYAHPNARVVIE